MTQSEAIKVFEQRDIRSLWDDEGNETVTNCHAFKMRAADGKL
jgi:hypothetical protein